MTSIAGFTAGSTEDHDLQLDAAGNLLMVTALEDLRQRVVERLLFWVGEWYLDIADGVSYRTDIFQRQLSVGLASAEVTAKIRAVEGVVSVSGVQAVIDATSRRFSYAATVHSAFGSTEVNIGRVN